MPRRKVREEVKREDFLLSGFGKVKTWIRENTRVCVAAAAIVVVLGLAVWGYSIYLSNRNERLQYQLSAAIRDFQEYTMTGKSDSLPKAATTFEGIAREASGGLRDVARLYLARIAFIKGNKGEAKSLYGQVAKKPAHQISKLLAEKGVRDMESDTTGTVLSPTKP